MEDQYKGLNLKNKRRDRFMTQPELAEKLRVSVTTINHWERSRKNPSLRHLKALRDLFETSEK